MLTGNSGKKRNLYIQVYMETNFGWIAFCKQGFKVHREKPKKIFIYIGFSEISNQNIKAQTVKNK